MEDEGMETGWRLLMRCQGRRAGEFALAEGLTTLGRSDTNAVVVEDRQVSRCHAVLILDREQNLVLQDLGSKNGTRVAGHPIVRTRLRPGETFVIGEHEFQVLSEGPEALLPAGARRDQESTMGDTQGDLRRPGLAQALDPELFLGTSKAAARLLEECRRVASTEVNVLITGESGSGKGVVGRLLHRWSRRAGQPLVVVNCAAIPHELAESELFGHRKGSFTGATSDRVGKFEAADGGTLLLDEVGDMSLAAQAKILRAIEEREIERVGQPDPIKVDVRVMAATNKDLDQAVAEGAFRLDLMFRLATVRLTVPPLRERPDDIILLANCFLGELVNEIPSAQGSAFTPEAQEALLAHHWPGNVRELRNVVAQALILKDGSWIRAQDLRLSPTQAGPVAMAPTASLAEVEAKHIAAALEHHGWNILRTAEALGISRKTLRERIERMGLKRPEP